MPVTDTPLRQRIAELIRASGLSQYRLARMTGLRQNSLSRILAGERAGLPADTVARIARALELSPTALGKLMYECHPENLDKNDPGG